MVVIPCYDEPDPITTLASLHASLRPPCACEVLLLINDSDADDPALVRRNELTQARVSRWIRENPTPDLEFHVARFSGLPSRHAGVGLARKLGMDEAVARLARSEDARGIVVCLDADCVCGPNYLASIHRHFEANLDSPGASIYFEHDVTGDGGQTASYELFLRYYVEGLRYTGFPHAFHTIGSCMAVRSEAYVRQGGMNRRQGGEDFYFLHKLTHVGRLSEIRDTIVIPSSRPSTRAPFGTGRILARLGESELHVYSPPIFEDLKRFVQTVPSFYGADRHSGDLVRGLPDSIGSFLADAGFAAKLVELNGNTASADSFRKRFFQWFNGFRVLKYVHHATRRYYPKQPVLKSARTLLTWMRCPDSPKELLALLSEYRRLQRDRYGD